jgi:ribosome-binding factor A
VWRVSVISRSATLSRPTGRSRPVRRRIERINHLLRQEISVLLTREVKDPRLNRFITVTRVDTSSDLTQAEVFVSVMGDEAEKVEVLEALASASGFFHRELRDRVTMRSIPTLIFCRDDTIEEAAQVLQLMKKCEDSDVNKGEH